jgi:benzodiazapine receptor
MLFDREAEPGKNRPLLAFIILTLLVGASGTLFTEPNIPTWYAGLTKPGFNPPNWLFGPVWTTLYILMAVAAWRVWKRTGTKSPEMAAWGVQLALNTLWTPLFFGAHLLLVALVEMALLWLAIVTTAALFWRKDRIAGLMLLPYIAWVSFALCLNYAIWQLNGG